MEDKVMELGCLTVGELRELFAFSCSDELVEDALEDLDLEPYLVDGCSYEDEEEEYEGYDDEDDLEDDWDDWGEEDYEDDEDEDKDTCGAEVLDYGLETLALTLANEINSGLYTFQVVEDLYVERPEIVERVDYLINHM